jgi:hypothetical protein
VSQLLRQQETTAAGVDHLTAVAGAALLGHGRTTVTNLVAGAQAGSAPAGTATTRPEVAAPVVVAVHGRREPPGRSPRVPTSRCFWSAATC